MNCSLCGNRMEFIDIYPNGAKLYECEVCGKQKKVK